MNKYARRIRCLEVPTMSAIVDVYSICKAFNVTCSARSHAIKKLLLAGGRGHKDELTDLNEAIDAIRRSIELIEKGGTS